MRDLLAILGVVLAGGIVVAIPLAIVRFQRGVEKERLGELTLWATGRGMQTSTESAVPEALRAIYSGVASFTWRGGVLGVLTVSGRGDTTYSFWWIPTRPHASGTAYATAKRWGSGVGHTMPVVPTGDPAFDEVFDARAELPASVAAVFAAPLRASMQTHREGLDTVSWDGTRWSVTQRTQSETGSLWDRALGILEVAAA